MSLFAPPTTHQNEKLLPREGSYVVAGLLETVVGEFAGADYEVDVPRLDERWYSEHFPTDARALLAAMTDPALGDDQLVSQHCLRRTRADHASKHAPLMPPPAVTSASHPALAAAVSDALIEVAGEHLYVPLIDEWLDALERYGLPLTGCADRLLRAATDPALGDEQLVPRALLFTCRADAWDVAQRERRDALRFGLACIRRDCALALAEPDPAEPMYALQWMQSSATTLLDGDTRLWQWWQQLPELHNDEVPGRGYAQPEDFTASQRQDDAHARVYLTALGKLQALPPKAATAETLAAEDILLQTALDETRYPHEPANPLTPQPGVKAVLPF